MRKLVEAVNVMLANVFLSTSKTKPSCVDVVDAVTMTQSVAAVGGWVLTMDNHWKKKEILGRGYIWVGLHDTKPASRCGYVTAGVSTAPLKWCFMGA